MTPITPTTSGSRRGLHVDPGHPGVHGPGEDGADRDEDDARADPHVPVHWAPAVPAGRVDTRTTPGRIGLGRRCERRERLLPRGRDGRHATELDDLDRARDRCRRGNDEPDAAVSARPHDAEEAVKGGAVDEEEPAQVEQEHVRPVDRGDPLVELAHVRQVELAREHEHRRNSRVAVLDLLELEGRHRLGTIVRRHVGFADVPGREPALMAIRFAHPVEEALARLFDEHGIAWRYEPHTFVLERDADGEVREAFTPDFFLPELGVYVECTVMRQKLTSRKRRKARLARERTGATVEILFKRDFERLARRWGLTELAEAGVADGQVSTDPASGTGSPGMGESARTVLDNDVRVEVDEATDGATVFVSGDVDLHVAPTLRARLTSLVDAGHSHVVLDLTEATFLDSMVLGVILAAQKRLAAEGGRFEVVVATPEIRRIFEITMLDQVLHLSDSPRANTLRDGNGAG